MGKFMVNPDSSFSAYEAKQQIVRVCRSTREVIYIPILPFIPADIVIIDNLHGATQTDA